MMNSIRRLASLAFCFLTAVCASGAIRVAQTGGLWVIENNELRVTVDAQAGSLTAFEKTGRKSWTQAPSPRPAAFANPKPLSGAERGLAFQSEFTAAGGQTYTLALKLTLPERGADLRVEADMADRTAQHREHLVSRTVRA